MDDPLPEGLDVLWEEFFRKTSSLNTAEKIQAVFDHPILFPLQRRREMDRMLEKAYSVGPKTVMEIGADKGGGILAWTLIPSVRRIIACEIRGTPYSMAFEKAFPDKQFMWLPRSSYDPETVTVVKNRLWMHKASLDCLFIDGDKSFFDLDFDLYSPMVRPNGIIFMHDITDAPIRPVFQLIANRGYRTETIINRSEGYEAEEREKQGAPIPTAHEGWLRHWKGASCGVGVIYPKQL